MLCQEHRADATIFDLSTCQRTASRDFVHGRTRSPRVATTAFRNTVTATQGEQRKLISRIQSVKNPVQPGRVGQPRQDLRRISVLVFFTWPLMFVIAK